jgi:hypothetical protein
MANTHSLAGMDRSTSLQCAVASTAAGDFETSFYEHLLLALASGAHFKRVRCASFGEKIHKPNDKRCAQGILMVIERLYK